MGLGKIEVLLRTSTYLRGKTFTFHAGGRGSIPLESSNIFPFMKDIMMLPKQEKEMKKHVL